MILKAGIKWFSSDKTDGGIREFYTLPSGRIIAAIVNQGIWYSDDDGKTWTQSNKTDATFDSLCITDTNRVLAGCSDTLWYSDDNGETWTQLTSLPATCYVMCKTSTGRIIGGFSYTIGIGYSDDNGETWTTLNSITATGRIIACTQGSGGSNYHIIYSDDDGETWAASNITGDGWTGMCVTPTGRIIVCSSSGIWYSDDNGVNWVNAVSNTYYWRGLCVTTTGRVIVCCGYQGRGIWYSDDNGITWIRVRRGEYHSVYAIPNNKVVIGEDATGILYSEDTYANRLMTKADVQALIDECKAYVQLKKQS